jgi:two-component system, NarL family, nitrate/nitrite response regulator NarL
MKILIADDFPLILEGLEKFLKDSGYENVLTATNGAQALTLINEEKPDIAILDMEMPHLTGLQIAQLCQQSKASTKIVFLTYRLDSYLFNKGLEAGIVGYLLKEDAMIDVQRCILQVANGNTFFSKKLLDLPEDATEELQKFQLLSPSEKKILKLIADGLSSADIAEKLFISFRTVEKHRSNIIQKLNIDSHKQKLSEWVLVNHKLFE